MLNSVSPMQPADSHPRSFDGPPVRFVPVSAVRSRKRIAAVVGTLALGVVVLGSFAAVNRGFFSSTENRDKAATGVVSKVYFNVGDGTYNVGDEFNVSAVLESTGNPVAVAEITMQFDPAKVQILEVNPATYLTNVLKPASVVNNKASILLSLPYTIPSVGKATDDTIVRYKLKAKATGQTQLSFDQALTRAPRFGGGPTNIIGEFESASLTFTQAIPQAAGMLRCDQAEWLNVSAQRATVGAPLRFNCKTTTQQDSTVKLRIVKDSEVVKTLTKDIGASELLTSEFSYTPTEAGVHAAECQVCNRAGTLCTDWGYAATEYTTPSCSWCAGECVPRGSTSNCSATPLQDVGKTCAVQNNACAEVSWQKQCSVSVKVVDQDDQPATASAYLLDTRFRVQGVTKPNITTKVEFGFRYTNASDSALIKKYVSTTATSTSSGVLTLSEPVTFGVGKLQVKDDKVEVFLKTPYSLRRLVGAITLDKHPTQNGNVLYTLDATSKKLLIGDFHPRTGGDNQLMILDANQPLRHVVEIRNPLTDDTLKYDTNHDGMLSILDVGMIVNNLTELTVEGDEL